MTTHARRQPAVIALAIAATVGGPACMDGGMDLGKRQQAVLGDVEWRGTCDAAVVAATEQAAFIARVVVSGDAWRQCVSERVADPARYIPCDPDGGWDPVATREQHASNAIAASRSVNDLAVACDASEGGWGSTTVDNPPGFYGDEELTLNFAAIAAVGELALPPCSPGVWPCRDKQFPYPFDQVAATLIHENMHDHGYYHGGDDVACNPGGPYDDMVNSMPYIVDSCVVEVVAQSMAVCGDVCESRSGDDIGACVERGRLILVDDLGVNRCSLHFDPHRHGLGMLQVDGRRLQALDMMPHGLFFPGGWRNSPDDRIVGAGKLTNSALPGFVVQSGWGLGAVRWNAAAGTGFHTAALSPNGTTLAHSGDGDGTWTLDGGDTVHGVARFSSGSGNQEILVRGTSGLGILAVVSGGFRTRSRVPHGTAIAGPHGTFAVTVGTVVDAVGDFDADGRTEVLVHDPTSGVALLQRTDDGAVRALDVRPYGSWIGSWNHAASDRWVAVGDFDGDQRAEVLVQSGWGLGMIGMPSGQTRLATEWLSPHGVDISGVWTMRASDQFHGAGRLEQTSRDSVVIRGDSGLAVLSFDSATRGPYIAAGQHVAIGGWIGQWRHSAADQLGPGVGDFDGDGYANFVIRSPWGLAVIGRIRSTAALRQGEIQRYDCEGGIDSTCHGGLFGGWLARRSDTIAGILPNLRSGSERRDILLLRGRER